MRLPFPFRLASLLLAALLVTMLFVVMARWPENAADERKRAEQAARLGELIALQQTAQMACNALTEPARMRQSLRDLAAIWRRHQDWRHQAALKTQLADFEEAIVHAETQGPARVAQSLNALLLVINQEIAATLDLSLRDARQTPRIQSQILLFFSALGALLIVSLLGFAMAARLRQIGQALGEDLSGKGSPCDALVEAAQNMRRAHDECRLALSDAQARFDALTLAHAVLQGDELRLQARTQALASICGEGVWEWDMVADRMQCSAQWARMLGYAEAATPTRLAGWLALIHPEDRAQAEGARLGFESGNLPEFEMDLRFMHAAGDWRVMRVRCLYACEDGRRLVYGAQVDCSAEHELKAAQESLRLSLEATRAELIQTRERMLRAAQLAALGQLSGSISDEISTPLGIALTAASSLDDESRQLQSVLQSGAVRRSDLDRYLRVASDASRLILRHAERAADLARSFRHVSTDQVSEEKRQFFIEAYFTEILLTLAPQFKKTPHCFLFDCPDNPEIDSYPGVFTQIFTHLVCNALQHAFSPDRPGVLAIRVRCPDENELELVFSDNGCGIPDELHEQVFEPFHPGRKGPHRGGLGLAMTRKLVEERLAGRVWIENTPGGGVTVMIRIPVDSNRSKA